VEIVSGPSEWYGHSPQEQDVLLGAFPRDGTALLAWPPPELRRQVLVVLDVSKSVFLERVLSQGVYRPYYCCLVSRLESWLTNAALLKPGDRIALRGFGVKPRFERVLVDQRLSLEIPPDTLHLEGQRWGERTKRLRLRVLGLAVSDRSAQVQRILSYYREILGYAEDPAARPCESPLLDAVYSDVTALAPSRLPSILVYVTDGFVDFTRADGSPGYLAATQADVAEESRDCIAYVSRRQLTVAHRPVSPMRLVFVGINDLGSIEFRRAFQAVIASVIPDSLGVSVETLWSSEGL
jgi:hypothetical protein